MKRSQVQVLVAPPIDTRPSGISLGLFRLTAPPACRGSASATPPMQKENHGVAQESTRSTLGAAPRYLGCPLNHALNKGKTMVNPNEVVTRHPNDVPRSTGRWRRTRIRTVATVSAVTIAVAGLAGCTSTPSSPGSTADIAETGFALNTGEAKTGGTVRVFSPNDFSHLDPAMGNDGGVTNFYRLIYRNLTTWANEPGEGGTEVVPDMATDLGQPNEDRTVWTFTLRDGLKFEDGSRITAADLKYGIERSFDPSLAIGSAYHHVLKGAADYQGIYEDPDGLDSIEAVDDKTIRFTLEHPQADFASITAMSPMTPFPAGKVSSTTQIDDQPISSGPYRVEEYERGSHLTLVRNEEWDAETDPVRPAYPDEFEFLFGYDQNTIDQRLIAGQGEDANAISTGGLQPANLAQVSADENLRSRTVQSLPGCTSFLIMNTTAGPLQDVEVRRAISYAVDKNGVVDAIGGPRLASIATQMLLPGTPGRQEFDLYPSPDNGGDPEKAKQMLADAGYPDGISLVMDVRTPVWQPQSEAIQESLKKAGIEVTLNPVDQATYFEVIGTPSQQKDLAFSGWCNGWLTGETLLEPLFDGDRIAEKGNSNYGQLNDPAINKSFDEIPLITDLEEKQSRYGQLDRDILELAPFVPLVHGTSLQMVGTNVGNAFAHAGMTGYVDLTSVGLKDPEGR
ncbi:ABC transporter substrate-binding protein [Microbacterium sp. NPDC058342]|uniref:ABC transporter substrate-binding protein n=1 Tax=Microbacterium sp. NPDC058342 TaxID=3346454 RepID=UPI003666C5C0